MAGRGGRAASFLVPMMWVGRAETTTNPAWVILPLAFVAYLVLACITIFFNAALVHAANERLGGGGAGRAPTPAWVFLPLAFVAYLVLACITIFFNAALVHAANERLEGGD